ncbi:MAG: DUF4954 family protein [Muribaculaceae bacterium]|nr:DUF4954 family protein [Muribaculaceae bacterium]
MTHRPLTKGQINVLESYGCTCEDWSRVHVTEDFDPRWCRDTHFSGDIRLGRMERVFTRPGGVRFRAGIYRSRLHNCTVGDDVRINNVANYIANYHIGNNVFIENTTRIAVDGRTSFGVGTEVSVLNETGGREVPIYERLSAHVAYLIAMFRHDSAMTKRLCNLIKKHADEISSDMGSIGDNAEVINCGAITNVKIGENARVHGASRLAEGTICGSKDDPVYVGTDVLAEGFILEAGARVTEGAVLHHVFVGQATSLSHLFSAHDSLFFANCACENGEAAAIFAGPYTVTMHKSSLLIAGMFSFLNAGSGSNQSNHMYKLGPIHQGVVERGSKTTSDSYLLWPARIGPFSLVMGRHVNHPDTASLPFSYLIENYGRSYLVPGVNIKSVGTIRDALKWPKRDKRKTEDRLDFINFNLLSPYTASKMLKGIDLLDSLERTAGFTADNYSYSSMTIEARALRKGREYYRAALDKFMGNSVISRLSGVELRDEKSISDALATTIKAGCGEWVDISGLLAPKAEIEKLCDEIAREKIQSLEEVEERFRKLASEYYEMEWTWVAEQFPRWYGKSVDELTADDIAKIVDRWRTAVIGLDRQLYNDAKKEFSLVSQIGFGAGDIGCDEVREADFEEVRGSFENDDFVKMVQKHMVNKNELGDELLRRLHPLLKK